MRIIAGEFKSRQLRFPKTRETRPMMDRVKETVFNLLGEIPPETNVLDLFAGSGSLGLEALSRGAGKVYFVEKEKSPCETILENAESLGLGSNYWELKKMPAESAIKFFHSKKVNFSLVFLDPPFSKGYIKKILRLLDRFDIVKPLGKIVYQREPKDPLPGDLISLKLIQEKPIGQARIGIFLAMERLEKNG